MDKCFFCDKIIVPMHLITTEEIKDFFKEYGMDYTLNYTKAKFQIGNKIICLTCEEEFRNVSNYEEECNCEECKKQKEFYERFG